MGENRSSIKSARASVKSTRSTKSTAVITNEKSTTSNEEPASAHPVIVNVNTPIVNESSITPADVEVTAKTTAGLNLQDATTSVVDKDGVTYMTWTHVSDTTVEKPIYSKHSKFRTIKQWKRQVFTHCWFPNDKPPTAFMLVCHGLHEHGARYNNYMRGIVARTGIAVVGVDWHSHGRSHDNPKGPDGKMPSFHLFINDSLSLIDRVILGNYPAASQIGSAADKDWFLFGHSMGGCIALNLVLERPGFFKAVCLSAPLTDATFKLPIKCVLLPLLRCLSSLSPHTMLINPPEVGPHSLTHDLAKQDENLNDALVIHQPIRIRLSGELVKATKRIQRQASTITDPICIVHSTSDVIVDAGATEEFLAKISSEDVKFEKLDDWFHEIHNEGAEGLELVIDIFSRWIKEHLPTTV